MRARHPCWQQVPRVRARRKDCCPPRFALTCRLVTSAAQTKRQIRGTNHAQADRAIFVVNADGTGLRQIMHVAPRAELLSASFSPDGRLITFAMTGIGGKPDIWTAPVGGGELTPVTRSPEPDSAPEWDSAPDWDATTWTNHQPQGAPKMFDSILARRR